MAMVGPRPERPEIIKNLCRQIPRYETRMAVRPGVTGLAQIQHPADTDVESVRIKLRFDLYYITHTGIGLDFRLILATVFKVLQIPLWLTRWICRIPDVRVAMQMAQ